MKKTMAIVMAILIGVCILNGCIGQDDSEPAVTVRRVKTTDSEDETGTGTVAPQNPSQTPQISQTPRSPQSHPQTPQTSQTPQSPPQTPQSPQSPPSPGNLEEPTSEEEEDARRIALEDERVQDLIQENGYELEVIGCMLFPDGKKGCILLLELENGEKYTIIVILSEGTVEEIREGEGLERGEKNGD